MNTPHVVSVFVAKKDAEAQTIVNDICLAVCARTTLSERMFLKWSFWLLLTTLLKRHSNPPAGPQSSLQSGVPPSVRS